MREEKYYVIPDDDHGYVKEAANLIISDGIAATSFFQRKLLWGYNRADRVMGHLELMGIVSKTNYTHKREILVTNEEIKRKLNLLI